jgi:hypothetical protein
MTVCEKLSTLSHRVGMPLRCRRWDGHTRYVFCLADGTEYASVASLADGKRELRRLLKLYGPTLANGLDTDAAVDAHLASVDAAGAV